MVRAKTQQCACQLNHDEGLASLITDEMSYVHVDNSPFAIFTWKVLGIFKMEGVMAQAVWRYNIYRKIQWLIQFAVIITPVIIHTNQLVMCVFLEIIVLLFDILLWYNGSSMSQEKMAINCSHCCKHLVRAKTQQCACQLNHDEGLASLITDEMSYVHVDNCAPF
ncbi:hypothetical protein C7G54_10170 [Acinetobacter baumannii]|uniref:Uncharacterized protein n=4 Tax=Acinetobacter baumannii TaxID=470 RepID=A0A219CC49_ACIBA|nr:hypothetical protein [Acinetobacter baumannii]AEP05974.1 hypothetical protein ABZJ_01514 [Acinetobacter baumannii MDR-ZJ06]AHX30188.1 hypothetical protein A478_16745 [Acinetobacter baumannii AC12]AYX93971.1 hypothetical protein EG365_15440 [Acinetobacter sp. FDAARGOS_494]AYY16799.1 hypothetical protein EG364_05720 [Acinetobacter sp. FDAARGOS_560]EGT94874.1 hypothetical protein ABNIH1_05485 [Acinetobacter baumannii ABNIH1]EGT96027.1 hypothetical protein ABNIH3_12210 [Acinetobacter baumannii